MSSPRPPKQPAPVPHAGQGERARRVALAALERVRHGAFLAPTLNELLSASDLAREDRALVTDVAYGAVRRLPQLDAALAPLLAHPQRLPPQVHDALRLGAFEVLYRGTPRYAAVSAWVGVVKASAPRLAPLVNAVLRRVEAPQDQGPALAAAMPAWLYARLEAALGQEAPAAAAAMLEPEPLWLTAFGPEAETALAADGAGVRRLDEGDGWPRSLAVMAPVALERLRAYEDGLVQPQNPSSLAAALYLGAGSGAGSADRVLDLASGRGVKSAVLAALGAQVTAVELDPRRQAAAAANLARLGLSVEHVVADLLRPLDLPPAPLVLLDAPCSGTGTLRGHPEIKLRLRPEDVAAAASAQVHMLATAAAVTAPGGVLLYAVCALTPEEGPEAVAGFLAHHPDFSPEPAPLPLPNRPAGAGTFVLPLNGLDGFYLARLRRAGP